MSLNFTASLRRILHGDATPHVHVHFHAAADGRPFVCDVVRCDSPSLTPREVGM